jgi:exopolyphosphatase/guanosine-5'-triphosphate,3'-diphosphate pyrophosphatase
MRIATVDVGTNTANFLVADITEDGILNPVFGEKKYIRLGKGLTASGRVDEAAMERLRAALVAYKGLAERYAADEVVVGATSASRDAANRDELIDFVDRETGLGYEILSGDEEATWTFLGAVSAFPGLEGSCAVLDIGGGSTEVVVGRARPGVIPEEGITFRHSFDVGAVRMTERFFEHQPPARRDVEAAERYIDEVLGKAEVPLDGGLPLIGAAGTLVALAMVDRGIEEARTLEAQDTVLRADEVGAWRKRLLALSYEEVLALNPAALDGRADAIGAGVLILDVVLRRYGVDACRVSPRGIRHGLALRYWHRHRHQARR